MANSKAYLSFVLLFAFLLSSHVLAHELHETSPKNQRSYNDEGIFKHPNPTLSQDLEIDRGGSSMPSFRHLVGSGSKTPRLEHDEDSIRSDNAEVDEQKESKNDWIFPQASRKIMLGTGRGHYTSLYVIAPNCKDGDPECEEDLCFRKQDPICFAMRRHNMMRPSKFDWRAFATFPDKTSGMRHGGKTGYGVPRKEDVGGETMN